MSKQIFCLQKLNSPLIKTNGLMIQCLKRLQTSQTIAGTVTRSQAFPPQKQETKVGHFLVKNTEHSLRVKSDSNVSLDDPVKMNIDALAVLGRAAHELTRRRRESIKPHLHKDYSTLSSSAVPVTKFLFGDDLQTELTHIKATKNTGATASSPITSGKASCPSGGSHQEPHFFGRAPQFCRPTNYKLQSNSRRYYNQKKDYK